MRHQPVPARSQGRRSSHRGPSVGRGHRGKVLLLSVLALTLAGCNGFPGKTDTALPGSTDAVTDASPQAESPQAETSTPPAEVGAPTSAETNAPTAEPSMQSPE